MTTDDPPRATCTARAAIAGNPSDGYGGAVLSIPLPALAATVVMHRDATDATAPRDPDLATLLAAAAAEFVEITGELPDTRPADRLAATTTIPRSVGLAGSSALVIATLRALAIATDHRWDADELARAAWRVERRRLGIAGGMQDQVVQSHARPVLMEFDPRRVTPVTIPADLPLVVAYDPGFSESSDVAHQQIRRQAPANPSLIDALATQARRAADALCRDDRDALARAIDTTFDLRCELTDVAPRQIELVVTGRNVGAAVNNAGSGGSVIALAPDDAGLDRLVEAYERAGARPLTKRAWHVS